MSKMEIFTVLAFIFGILILISLGILFFVNNLLLKRQKVDFSFDSIIKCLGNRTEILDKMAIFIEKNTTDETKYINSINKSSINLSKILSSNKDNIKNIKDSSKLLQKFITLKTIYHKFETNKTYNDLIEKINLNEDRLIYAIDIYDQEVSKYNQLFNTKFNSFIGKMFKIKEYDYYNK